MQNEMTVLSAFAAGLISFLSPCVLPLVPAYLSFLAGVSLEEMRSQPNRTVTRKVLLSAGVFVLGFSTVFVLLGATATVVGHWLIQHAQWLGRVAGVVLILFGLHLTGVLKIPVLLFEKRFHIQGRQLNVVGIFFIGAAFAFGWSPCIGPLLAGILTLAGAQETIGQGMFLLAVYSAGLGLPFILAAAAVERFIHWSQRFRNYLRWIEIIAGGLLIIIGIVMLFDGMMRLSSFFTFFNGFGL